MIHRKSGLVVKVKVQELLDILVKNMVAHRNKYDKAHKNWRTVVIKEMVRNLDEARKPYSKIKLRVKHTEPTSHEDDYEAAIGMLEMALSAGQTTLELTESPYREFVRDEWDWTDLFIETSATYGA